MRKKLARLNAELTLLSAAVRHLRDAEHLADASSPRCSLDQAYHLAGFGPECARKAAIAASWANKPLGHDLGDDAELVLELAVALNSSASRYEVRGWEVVYPALAAWRPDCRYQATGTSSRSRTEPLLREAWLAATEIMAAMWADGRVALEALQ
ncbi:MAG: hypothetical protein ABJE95_30205 [Byssovorax sp.]